MPASRKSKAGFTLVELLAVMAIIAILMSLLLPAVNAVRERARSIACSNNISQLVLAMLNYESTHKVLPINWGINTERGENAHGHTWLTLILPQLENDVIYRRIRLGEKFGYKESGANVNSGRWNRYMATLAIPAFRCPSDNHRGYLDNQQLSFRDDVGVTNYKACAGSNWSTEVLPGAAQKNVKFAKGRNANNTDGRDTGNGIICRGGFRDMKSPVIYTTAISDIKDGSGNTIAVGETAPLWDGYASWYGYDNATCTCGLPLNYNQNNRRPSDDRFKSTRLDCFLSRHSGGANFGFCDRSVRWIANGIDYQTYRALGTIDGEDIPGEF
jgi:prepilin-type N-terminal cleavage/methylation domain-containing protein/prepilin-type processing-associated H-X9-DG protein